MIQSLTRTLTQESPLTLAREVIWRTRRRWEKNRRLARIQEASCTVTFRNTPYYKPDLSAFNEEDTAITAGFADDICNGRFNFMGYPSVELGRTPKWNFDFVSGHEWPQIALQNGECIRFDGSDVKVPYELSRLQFLPVLGKAHVLTGDQRYRDSAKELLSCWIKQNPVGIGVNWSVAMEVALRAMSMCFLLNFLHPLRASEQQWLASVTRSLWQHFLYIEANIEFSHLIRSNHYLSNILGLYCLSVFLDGDAIASKRDRYRRLIEAEIFRQVYRDGGDYEASIGYHVLVTQMFTSAMLLMRASGMAAGAQFLERLRCMYRFMEQLAAPSGQLPHFGDCDDGRVELLLDDLRQMRLLPVSERNSLRVPGLLNLGKCLFSEDTGTASDAKWYGLAKNTGTASLALADTASSTRKVEVFPESGVGIIKAQTVEVLFFAARNGIGGKGSHTHNDKLSLVLRLHGEEVLCDPGTGCYTRDTTTRNRFRMTRAHNTVVVDDLEQNTIEPEHLAVFRMGREAEVSAIQQGEEHGRVYLKASHRGYRSRGVIHTRTVRLSANERVVLLEDILDGSGRHRFEINFHLAPGWSPVSVEKENSQICCCILGARHLNMIFSAPGEVRAERCGSLISMTYGGTTPTTVLRFSGEAELPVSLVTRVCWGEQSAA